MMTKMDFVAGCEREAKHHSRFFFRLFRKCVSYVLIRNSVLIIILISICSACISVYMHILLYIRHIYTYRYCIHRFVSYLFRLCCFILRNNIHADSSIVNANYYSHDPCLWSINIPMYIMYIYFFIVIIISILSFIEYRTNLRHRGRLSRD